MKNKAFKYLLLTISIISLSCESKIEKHEQNSKTGFFEENGLGAFKSNDRLILNSKFNECGEWGGHKEEMVIYLKPKKGFYLDYKKFSVSCDSMDSFLNQPYQKLETSKTIHLKEIHKTSITNYINRLLKSKMNESYPGTGGNTFTAITSDSSLVINVYDNKKIDIESYNKLQSELGFSLTIPKENE